VGCATTNDATTKDATTNTDATTKAEEFYRPAWHARAHDVSGPPTLI